MKRNFRETGEVGEKQFDLILDKDSDVLHPRVRKPPKQAEKGRGWQFISLAGELGFDIALPMVMGLVGGRYLDARWGTHPRATLVLLGFGFVIACTSLIRIVRDAMKKR